MSREFLEFLIKQNALALAVGVVIGAAIGRVVSSIVADLMMPVVGLAMPGGDWRAAAIFLSETTGPDGARVVTAINYGAFLGTVVDFTIVALVVFLIVRAAIKPSPSHPTRTCPFCKDTIPADATRCRACTSPLA